jgi:predicted phosphodiesterase
MACETGSERNIYLCILREVRRRLGQHAEIEPELVGTALDSVLSDGAVECTFYRFQGVLEYEPGVVLTSLLRDIKSCMARDGLRPDFVVFTGDLAFSGKPAEYAHARRFFDEVLNATGVAKNMLFTVPGNHDVERPLVTYGATVAGQSLADTEGVNKILGSPEDRHLFFARFKGYAEFVNDYLQHLSFDDENYFYVRMLDLCGCRVALLGLNSSWLAESDEDEKRRLVIGEKQVRAALDAARAAAADLTVAMFHHPPSLLRDFDQSDSLIMLQDSCDFILHGHLHRAGLGQFSSPDGSAVVIAGGAGYQHIKYPNSFNLVRLDLTAGEGTIYLWRYTNERGGFWVRDNALYKSAPDGTYTFGFSEQLKQRLVSRAR